MQKTRLRKIITSILLTIKPIFSDSWSNRSLLFLSLLTGYYFTNSFLSYLLDKSVNTIFLSMIIIIIMEFIIRSLLLTNYSKLSLFLNAINNFRIGSSYALILEAFKLGS